MLPPCRFPGRSGARAPVLGAVVLALLGAGRPPAGMPLPVPPAPAPLPMPAGPPAAPPAPIAPTPLPATIPQVAATTGGVGGGRQAAGAPPPPNHPVRTASLALTGLMDRAVDGRDGRSVGHVIDVLVDDDGHPEALLVETGGFLGVGNRRIAVGWEDVWFPEHDPNGPVRVNMTANEVRSAPAFVFAPRETIAVGPPTPPPGPPPPVPPAPGPLPPPSNTASGGVPVAVAPPPLAAPRSRPTRFR